MVKRLSWAGMFVSNAFTDDWRMRKYDLNYDMVIELSELRESGCRVSNHIFKHADKNGDGVLNRREAQKVQHSSLETSVQEVNENNL